MPIKTLLCEMLAQQTLLIARCDFLSGDSESFLVVLAFSGWFDVLESQI